MEQFSERILEKQRFYPGDCGSDPSDHRGQFSSSFNCGDRGRVGKAPLNAFSNCSLLTCC